MKIRTAEYFITESINSIKRNGLMSVASLMTVALSLLILGMFTIVVMNLNHLASVLESQVQVTVYLQDSLKDVETREIGTRITKLPGVTRVTFVNKEEAMGRFKQRLGTQQGLLAELGEANPLPNSFEVKVDRPERVKAVALAIAQLKGIEAARYGQEVVEQLFGLTRMVRIFGVVLIVFLGLAALFIIVNTIRLTVFARRREIGIMKYVGATDWFIRWPFIIEGVLLGSFGAFISTVLLTQFYSMVTGQVYETLAFLPLLPQYPLMGYVNIFLLFAGICIGALGSVISVKKFLKV
ncbi:MAG TPA: permease-like cell division protein FtsX [Negativicutes bacterium]|nr:permease-like cell division protein FtsX [Negativicutes bacterium]